MRKSQVLVIVAFIVLTAAASFAYEMTPRHMGLGGSSLAIYNFPGMEPVFENLATMCTAQDYSITLNVNHVYNMKLGSSSEDGFNHTYRRRDHDMQMGLRVFVPLVNREEEMERRLGLLFEPRYGYGYIYELDRTNDDVNGFRQPKRERIYKPLSYGGRFGIAYGIADEFAFGLGLSTFGARDRVMLERTVFEDADDYNKTNDEYWYMRPQLWVFEAGILIRPTEYLQIGLNYVNGDERETDPEVDIERELNGEEDDVTERITIYHWRPRRIGLGVAWAPDLVEHFQLLWDLEYVQKVEFDEYETYNSIDLSFGVEKRWEFFTLRGGVDSELGMGSDARRTFSPNAAAGFTIFNHMIADLGFSYGYGWWNDDDNTGENLLRYGLSLGGTF